MTTEETALCELEEQLRKRGYAVTRTGRNSPQGDLHATRDGRVVRFEVKGLAKRNAVWIQRRQVEAVDFVVVYIAAEKNAWVLPKADASALVEQYYATYEAKHGHTPPGPGWNSSQFPPPTGWTPLDRLS